MTQLLHQFVEAWAQRTPDAPALIEAASGRQASFADLDRLANRFGHLFRASDVAAGDRVIVALENSITMVGAYLGAMKAGAVAVPLPAGARSDRLAPAILDCSPRVVVTDGATAIAPTHSEALQTVPVVFTTSSGEGSRGHRMPAPSSASIGVRHLDDVMAALPDDAVTARVDEETLSAIIYTSGSTGRPRGVMLTHRNFVANARSIVEYLGLTADDRVMCVLAFHYVYGLSLLHTHLLVGGSLVIDNRFVFPNVVLEAMREHRVTGFAGVPSSFALLLHRSNLREAALPDLRYVTQAGGGMPPAQILEWLEHGPDADFYVMYGATEAAARLSYLPPSQLRRRLGSIGRPIPGVAIRVLTEAGEDARAGDVGELVASGPNISSGYWNNPDETRERFGPHGYRTGDLGYADRDGYLYLVGRLHDMIKVGAHRVGAREIEEVLHEHPVVHEVAVVPAPHDMLGEAPVAYVALRHAPSDAPQALRAFCAERLAPHKVPVRIIVLNELPKLAGAGKIDRRLLRDMAAGKTAEARR